MGPAVQVLVFNGDEAFVHQRVSLPRHLDPVTERLRLRETVREDIEAASAGRCVNAGDLLIAPELVDRDRERHQVQIEPALRVLAGVAQRQQVEDRLDVGVEAVIPLAGESYMAAVQRCDGLPV